MVGEEARPGKKLKKLVKIKKAERPPANPVIDVSRIKPWNQKNILYFVPNKTLVTVELLLP